MIALESLALGGGSERISVEAAILALLEPLSVRQGRYLARLDQYNGEIGAGGVNEIIGALGGGVPAVLVQTGSATRGAGSMSRTRYAVRLTVEILVASGHLRSHEARNVGDEAAVHDAAVDPGAYRILADVRAALDGRNLGIAGAGAMRWITEQVVLQAPALTAWVSRFEVDLRLEHASPAAHGAVRVLEIEARSNLENSAAVNPVAAGKVASDG